MELLLSPSLSGTTIFTLGANQIIREQFALKTTVDLTAISSLLTFKVINSLFLTLFIFIFLIFRPEGLLNLETMTLFLILSLSFIFKSFEVIELWYDSKLQSKYVVFAKTLAFLITSLLKLGAILTQSPLHIFGIIYSLEFLLVSFILVMFLWHNEKKKIKLSFDFKLYKKVLTRSWPLFFCDIGFTLFNRIDQVIIHNMLSAKELGQYSAAVKLTEIWYFLPASVAISYFSTVINQSKQDEKTFYHQISALLQVMTALALLIIIPTIIFSPQIMVLAFGEQFVESSEVLSILICSLLFVSWGFAQEPWDISKNFIRFRLYRVLAGALLNIGLNLLLIPLYGIKGVAYATLFAHITSYFLMNFYHPESREFLKHQILALISLLNLRKLTISIKKSF